MATTFSLVSLLLLLLSSNIFSTQSQSPIKTVVVLVMENRSFDHMLGWMKKTINPSINGVTGSECNPLPTHAIGANSSSAICFTDDAEFVDLDPGHSFKEVLQQVFRNSSIPSMSGFVEQALSLSPNFFKDVMKGFSSDSLPIYSTLVNEFAVFDRWFSSIPGPTQPNRLFVYSATSQGSTSHVAKQLGLGYPQKTIFDSLHDEGKSFGVYFQNIPTTLFFRNLRKLKYISNFHEFDLRFQRDAREGKLPNLAVIEPRYFSIPGFLGNGDHPSHDVADGQKLDGNTGPSPFFFNFDRLGVRVPTIMVSPWINKRTVISRPNGPEATSEFEHSSIPATIKKLFNLSSNFLTHRDAWAGTFEGVVQHLTSPRTDCPDVTPLRKTTVANDKDEERKLSQFQREVVQLAAVLNGDHFLSSFPDEMTKNMNVNEAHEYVKAAVERFIRASKEAIMLGADESAIVDMRSSLTTRSSLGRH
ncbi:Non-specific phospholipase C6 [Linum perenne]